MCHVRMSIDSHLLGPREESSIHFDSCVVELGRYERSMTIWRRRRWRGSEAERITEKVGRFIYTRALRSVLLPNSVSSA